MNGRLMLAPLARGLLRSAVVVEAGTPAGWQMSEQGWALQLRRYEGRDAPAVWRLYKQAWAQVGLDPGDGPWDRDLRDIESAYLASGGEFLVAEIEGRVVATGGLQRVDRERAEIRRVSVDAAFQRRGYASILIDRLETAARQAGFTTLVLDTTVRNEAAQMLYRSRGYVAVGRVTPSTGFESVVFEKRLPVMSSARSVDGWEPFSVEQVLAVLGAYEGGWWLSGGHALDVFVGRTTRPHGDIDVGVPRHEFGRLREYLGDRLEFVIAQEGKLRRLPDGDLDRNVDGLWGRDTPDGPWRLQVNLELAEQGVWIYRRDDRVRRPIRETVWRARELPYRNPAVGLLWKARDTTPTDDIDFANVEPLLPPYERTWLARAIAVAHPASRWSTELRRSR